MAPDDETALEAKQEVLAGRLDRFERPSVHLLGDTGRLRARMRRLDLEPLPHEHLQPPRGACERVAFGHTWTLDWPDGARGLSYLRSAAAGATAAELWALAEPLDRRVLRYDYSDVSLLGKAVTRGSRWRIVGVGLHGLNGAVFGLAYEAVSRRTGLDRRRLALGLALAEHVALYPLAYFVDRYHPARGEPGIPPLLRSPRAFAQATWRHALFGAALGRLA